MNSLDFIAENQSNRAAFAFITSVFDGRLRPPRPDEKKCHAARIRLSARNFLKTVKRSA